jgi:hypothetical protein
MISYSDQSQRAFAAIYRPYNDMDIYVEDRSLVGLYERAFSKLLGNIAKITSVIPLGGREAVLAEAKRLRADRTRNRFFLIDGDFYWIFHKSPRIRNLYTLRSYCFENLAYVQSDFIQAAHALAPSKTKAQIEATFTPAISNQIFQLFWPLFEVYAINHLLCAGCQTAGFAPSRLLKNNPDFLPDSNKIRQRIKIVLSELRKNHSWTEIITTKQKIRSSIDGQNISDARFISGKYLASVLHRWFQKEVGFSGNQNQLISLILAQSDFSLDQNLALSLKRSAKRR